MIQNFEFIKSSLKDYIMKKPNPISKPQKELPSQSNALCKLREASVSETKNPEDQNLIDIISDKKSGIAMSSEKEEILL